MPLRGAILSATDPVAVVAALKCPWLAFYWMGKKSLGVSKGFRVWLVWGSALCHSGTITTPILICYLCVVLFLCGPETPKDPPNARTLGAPAKLSTLVDGERLGLEVKGVPGSGFVCSATRSRNQRQRLK